MSHCFSGDDDADADDDKLGQSIDLRSPTVPQVKRFSLKSQTVPLRRLYCRLLPVPVPVPVLCRGNNEAARILNGLTFVKF